MHTHERRIARRDTNRLVRPFEWGADYMVAHANGDDPRLLLSAYTERALAHSDDFYALPPINDYQLTDNLLTWTSAVPTPSPENNTVRARFFPPVVQQRADAGPRRAVVMLPHWNAERAAYAQLGRIFARL